MNEHNFIVAETYRQLKLNYGYDKLTNISNEDIFFYIDSLYRMRKKANPDLIADFAKIRQDVIEMINISIEGPQILDDQTDHIEWLKEKKPLIDWKIWNRYREFLSSKLPDQVVESIDTITDSILSRLEDPFREPRWDRRGLVVGDVQSGKTSNFIGLICKACDAGYKLVIVLSGQTDDLRTQTQRRLDQGFLGYDSSKITSLESGNNLVGAGHFQTSSSIVIHSGTSSNLDGDFNKASFRTQNIRFGDSPVLFVVKKNSSVLRNLFKELSKYSLKDREKFPLIIIDDESDYASVNTNQIDQISGDGSVEQKNPSTINKLIRSIVDLFGRSAYIGYTATPYANIFIYPNNGGAKPINGEDLFPRSFIVNLPSPSNYFGPRKIFPPIDNENRSNWKFPLIKEIDEKAYDLKSKLPSNLEMAILHFYLVIAIRKMRGQERNHNTMLIHTFRLNVKQISLFDLVLDYVSTVSRMLLYGDLNLKQPLLMTFKEIFDNDITPGNIEILNRFSINGLNLPEWSDIEMKLIEVAKIIEVRLINSVNKEGVLDYDKHPNGLNVIVIGGDKLSRGLTLEDLSVSYFTRESKMYDTLLQMGRWFGYKDGFIDLCRLYTTPTLVSWYAFISKANEELREEFNSMTNCTPLDFGLRVRSHPDGMIVTNLSKMKNTRSLSLGLSGKLISTTILYRKNAVNDDNLTTLNSFVSKLGKPILIPDENGNGFVVWSNIHASYVLDFLTDYKSHPLRFSNSESVICEYIRKKNTINELTNWTIVLVNVRNSHKVAIGNYNIGQSSRSDEMSELGSEYAMITGRQIITPSHEMIDLSQDQITRAFEFSRSDALLEGKTFDDTKVPSPRAIKKVRKPTNGLLLIYPLTLSGQQTEVQYDNVIVSYAISFPVSSDDTPIEYNVNAVFWEKAISAKGD